MAIVGGANLILSHEPMLALSMLRYSCLGSSMGVYSHADLQGFFLPMDVVTLTTKEQMGLVVERGQPVLS